MRGTDVNEDTLKIINEGTLVGYDDQETEDQNISTVHGRS